MKIDEMRKKRQETLDMVTFRHKINNEQEIHLQISKNGLDIYKVPFVLPDNIAIELRDWLIKLYGLPK